MKKSKNRSTNSIFTLYQPLKGFDLVIHAESQEELIFALNECLIRAVDLLIESKKEKKKCAAALKQINHVSVLK